MTSIPIDIIAEKSSHGQTEAAREATVSKYNRSQKHRDAQRRWRAANPQAKRDQHYRLRYGLTVVEYDARFAACKGRCQCCGQPETSRDHRTDDIRSLAVDHDHKTGEIRGLLCRRCNIMVGTVENFPDLYAKAKAYLG